jgi:hypothetical protein
VPFLKWTIGDVTITRIAELELAVPYFEKRPYIKEARPEVVAEMPWLYPHFVTPKGSHSSSGWQINRCWSSGRILPRRRRVTCSAMGNAIASQCPEIDYAPAHESQAR